MDLQNAFYIIGTIAMISWLVVLVIILVIVYRIRTGIRDFKRSFRQNIVSIIKEKNVQIGSALGMSVAHYVIDKIRRRNQDA